MQDKPSYKKTVKRLVAYVDNEPVGTVDVIITDETIEIDSFGVIEQFQRQGIGSTIQAYIGNLANERPVILVAMEKTQQKICTRNKVICIKVLFTT